MDLQPKLRRALQEKSFKRLGGTKTIPIDVRLIAATNRNLTQMMGDKLFRSDLYYRLKVFPITAPPLRDHAENIPALSEYFTRKYSREMSKQVETISSDTMRALVSWPWPGNVRELRNFIERSVILSRGSTLRAPLVELRADAVQTAGGTLAEIEREYIVRVLQESGGVISAAATRLGVPRTTLNAMMRKLGISCAGFPLIRSDQCEQCRRPMVLFGLERDQLRIVCGVCAAMRTGLSPLAVPAAVIVSLRCKPAI